MARPRYPICIYCHGDNTTSRSRDHVVQSLLGRFRGALTLDCVCDSCNNALSSLELRFGRDSLEGLSRFLYGVKDASASDQLGGSRVTPRFVEEGDLLSGSKIRPRANADGDLEFETPLQVLIRHPDHAEPVALLEDEITPESLAPFLKNAEVFITSVEPHDVARITDRMQRCGFIFVGEPQIEKLLPRTAPEFMLRTDGIVDEEVRRVVAKIAFNYLAFVAGPAYVLQRAFDSVRSAILRGDPVLVNRMKVELQSLATADRAAEYGDGHIVTVHSLYRNMPVIGQVCSFNRITYVIELAPLPLETGGPFVSAHFFDLQRRMVTALPLAFGVPARPAEIR